MLLNVGSVGEYVGVTVSSPLPASVTVTVTSTSIGSYVMPPSAPATSTIVYLYVFPMSSCVYSIASNVTLPSAAFVTPVCTTTGFSGSVTFFSSKLNSPSVSARPARSFVTAGVQLPLALYVLVIFANLEEYVPTAKCVHVFSPSKSRTDVLIVPSSLNVMVTVIKPYPLF